MSDQGWIGIDLDGTLVEWGPGLNESVHVIGAPIPTMVARVKDLLLAGVNVRIFTARVAVTGDKTPQGNLDDEAFAATQRAMIEDWCETHLGQVLPITATKDYHMYELWDDRCKQVISNTGRLLEEVVGDGLDQILEIARRPPEAV